MKDSLAKIRSRELVKDKFKKVYKAEIKQAARQKSTNKVVQKDRIITIGKAQ